MQTATDFLKLSLFGLHGEASGPYAIIALTAVAIAVIASRTFRR